MVLKQEKELPNNVWASNCIKCYRKDKKPYSNTFETYLLDKRKYRYLYFKCVECGKVYSLKRTRKNKEAEYD